MIAYTDGKWIATFNECGSLTEFRTVSYYGVPEGTIGGKKGARMIGEIRRAEPGLEADKTEGWLWQ